MISKALTYLTILAITLLPVELISASVVTINMQMHMSQQQQAISSNDCLHDMADEKPTAGIESSCCDDQAHDCQSCNNCPQAVSVMISPTHALIKISLLKTTKISLSHLLLHGVPQKNLLRPPRVTI